MSAWEIDREAAEVVWSELIEKRAMEAVEKSGEIVSKEVAVESFLRTEDGRGAWQLYTYLNSRSQLLQMGVLKETDL